MSLEWKEETGGNGIQHVLFDNETGKITGRIQKMGTAYYAFYNSIVLGEYVSVEFAKKAIENPTAPMQKQTEQSFRI